MSISAKVARIVVIVVVDAETVSVVEALARIVVEVVVVVEVIVLVTAGTVVNVLFTDFTLMVYGRITWIALMRVLEL